MDVKQKGIHQSRSVEDLHHRRLAPSGAPVAWTGC